MAYESIQCVHFLVVQVCELHEDLFRLLPRVLTPDCRFEAFSGMPDTPENRAKFLSNVPLGRLCEASDVASACLYFASDESSFVTGINMEVDGGRAV